MIRSNFRRRVVITGMGLISPIGNSNEAIWDSLENGRSGIARLTRVPVEHLPTKVGGEANEFTGNIDNFGSLEKQQKRTIKKGIKLMSREIQMGVAASQLALGNSGLEIGKVDPDRLGTMFGSDYIMTLPDEYARAIQSCMGGNGKFDFEVWADKGLHQVDPLWLLKYLPNMPASHVAIYNDCRGPSNSLTVREASSNLAIAEATTTINRGIADVMIAGATGTRIHILRTLHVALQEELASPDVEPQSASRPFDRDRTGMVIGEGAGTIILESLEHAQGRGATIYGEVVGFASGSVANKQGVADYRQSFKNVMSMALENSNSTVNDIGHIHAHGLSSRKCDSDEAQAIQDVFGNQCPPVTAAKSYMGNLGAGSGMVEVIASLLAIKHDKLFPIMNLNNLDDGVAINTVTEFCSPGKSFMNVNISPQGQASVAILQSFE